MDRICWCKDGENSFNDQVILCALYSIHTPLSLYLYRNTVAASLTTSIWAGQLREISSASMPRPRRGIGASRRRTSAPRRIWLRFTTTCLGFVVTTVGLRFSSHRLSFHHQLAINSAISHQTDHGEAFAPSPFPYLSPTFSTSQLY